ncbi:hypothetical protein D3C74_267930 [compost metagenome]
MEKKIVRINRLKCSASAWGSSTMNGKLEDFFTIVIEVAGKELVKNVRKIPNKRGYHLRYASCKADLILEEVCFA